MMKLLTNIFSCIFSVLFFIILASAPAFSQEAAAPAFKNTEEYYASLEKIELDPKFQKFLEEKSKSRYKWADKAKDVFEDIIRETSEYNEYNWRWAAKSQAVAGGQFSQTTVTTGPSSPVSGYLSTLSAILQEDIEDEGMTKEESEIIMAEAARILQIAAERANEAVKYATNLDGENLTQKEIYSQQESINISLSEALRHSVVLPCMTIEQLKAKYQSGCWACLVLNQLMTAFLKTASAAYSLSQKAGLTLLGLGAILWVLIWGLRNVSSLTQLEPGNILNELIKFAFKVALAYYFIVSGLSVVKTYFITPIMGTGAIIAQQFWDPVKLKPYTEDYVWDDFDEEEVAKAEQEARQKLEETPVAEKQESTSLEYTPEQLKLLESSAEVEKMAKEFDIPSFKIPGTNTGHLTSPAGCRIPPTVNCPKGKNPPCKGSTSHMGLDIGTSGVQGGVVFAMASGKLSYFGGASSSAGYAASIQTIDKNGNVWLHRYLHMMPKTHSYFAALNGTEVVQGQQIGFIGNTGISTGAHLHIDIKFTGSWEGKSYNSVYVDPLRLQQGKLYIYDTNKCNGKYVDTFPSGFQRGQNVPEQCWMTPGAASIDLSSTYVSGGNVSSGGGAIGPSSLIINLDDIKYDGPTDIMDKSVMNSILGATKAITDTTAENMVLGNAISCYATLKNGGAWHIDLWFDHIYPTNAVMWSEGILIWCTGFLLTMAVAYYLVDISYKMGFAVIAMPIVVGLWPFGLTRDKVMLCLSIMFKAAATFAFLAITTAFAMGLVDSVFDEDGSGGIQALYDAMDTSFHATANRDGNKENIDFVASKLQLFSITFLLLLFAFLYSYKLVQSTANELVNKFFPDKMFGNAQPMHHWATAATKAVKDIAMKPAGLARDIALHQTGVGVKNLVGGAVGKIRGAFRGGKEGGGGSAGAQAAGAGMKAAGAGMQAAGKGVQGAGKAIGGVAQAANAIPVVGQAVAAAGKAVGKGVEAAGKGVEMAGKAVKQAGKAVENSGKESSGEKAEDKNNKGNSSDATTGQKQ